MSDDESLPERLARAKRLQEKRDAGGALSETEREQLRRDLTAINDQLSAALGPLAETVVDFQRAMADAFKPVAELAAEFDSDDA